MADTPRKSTRTKAPTQKRKHQDEGNSEVLSKKLKDLQDKLKEAESTKKALAAKLKLSKQRSAPAPKRVHSEDSDPPDDDSSTHGNDSDPKGDSHDLFRASEKVKVKSREDPDKPRPKRPLRDQPPRDPSPTDHQEDPDPEPEPEHSTAPSDNQGDGSAATSHQAKLPERPWEPAPLAPGVDIKEVHRPANKMYNTTVRSMLAQAEHEFECLLFVEDAYPSFGRQVMWAEQCWEAVCVRVGHYYELSDGMRTLIKGRCSHGRSALLRNVRTAVKESFRMDPSAAQTNSDTARMLLASNAFYHKGSPAGKKLFQGEILTRAIQHAYLDNGSGVAVANQDKFSPISLPSIALICTLVDHCIREWETGEFAVAHLHEATDAARYRDHLVNATKWANLNLEATKRVRQGISKQLFGLSGPAKSKEVPTTSMVSQETLDEEKAALDAMMAATPHDSDGPSSGAEED